MGFDPLDLYNPKWVKYSQCPKSHLKQSKTDRGSYISRIEAILSETILVFMGVLAWNLFRFFQMAG